MNYKGSGIPDYRGPTGIYRRQPDYKPITYQQFTGDAHTRGRYWARAFLGWQQMDEAKANPVHAAVARLMRHHHNHQEASVSLITQNVDSLHLKALLGCDVLAESDSMDAHEWPMLELHGRLRNVCCNHACMMH